jgi:hypothetical protein
MTAFCSVFGNKVKVISGDAEGTRVARGPEADERAFDVLEVKLQLRFCRVQQPSVLQDGMNGTRVNGVKDAIESERVEKIVGNALLVAGQLDVF